jgi:hypothetical protein
MTRLQAAVAVWYGIPGRSHTVDDLASLKHAIEGDDALRALLAEVAPRLDDDPGHDLHHCLRVALWTVRLGGEEVDWRHAVAAALLHDIVNLPGGRTGRQSGSP